MRKLGMLHLLCGLVLVVASFTAATASPTEFFVSITGNDNNTCSDPTAPCRTLRVAFAQAPAGGQITVLTAGNYGPVQIDKSISIVNATSGTATICCSAFTVSGPGGAGTISGLILIIAGPTDVVTLRGLELTSQGFPNIPAVAIANALRVNIEDCTILGATGPGILVSPDSLGGTLTLATDFNIKIQNTTISDSSTGIKISSVPGVMVNAAITGSQIDNNPGGGIRVDASGGGAITTTVSLSHIGLNAGNGVNAVSGASGAVLVNLDNDIIASNAGAGVQSNGAGATVTVNRSTLSNNGSAWSIVGGATLLSFRNNDVTGPVGSLPSPASFQ